jgi:hypothetical protein
MFSRKTIGTTEAQINKQQHLNQEKLTKQKVTTNIVKICSAVQCTVLGNVSVRYAFYTKKYPGTQLDGILFTRFREAKYRYSL